MRIKQIELFYLALPEIRDQADGSQDSFVVRIRSDTGIEGHGESDSSPLLAFAAYCTPMSHGNIVNLAESLIGQTVESPDDIRRIYHHARRRALDMAQFPHAYAAADIALWDLLGRHLGQPVFRLLGHAESLPKTAYSSNLFQDTPEQTRAVAQEAVRRGFKAAKFGWGPMGHRGEDFDVALVREARAGLGDAAALMVDAGVVWQDDWRTAARRADRFLAFEPVWLEEPLSTEAIRAYAELSKRSPVPIAAGEGCNTVRAAEDMLENGKLKFLQIDPGRIGGITPAWDAYHLARRCGAVFVNHTYKSHISLAAAMAVFAGDAAMPWVEYCESGSPLVQRIVASPIALDGLGRVRLPETPGSGVNVTLGAVREFARQITISVDGHGIGTSSLPR